MLRTTLCLCVLGVWSWAQDPELDRIREQCERDPTHPLCEHLPPVAGPTPEPMPMPSDGARSVADGRVADSERAGLSFTLGTLTPSGPARAADRALTVRAHFYPDLDLLPPYVTRIIGRPASEDCVRKYEKYRQAQITVLEADLERDRLRRAWLKCDLELIESRLEGKARRARDRADDAKERLDALKDQMKRAEGETPPDPDRIDALGAEVEALEGDVAQLERDKQDAWNAYLDRSGTDRAARRKGISSTEESRAREKAYDGLKYQLSRKRDELQRKRRALDALTRSRDRQRDTVADLEDRIARAQAEYDALDQAANDAEKAYEDKKRECEELKERYENAPATIAAAQDTLNETAREFKEELARCYGAALEKIEKDLEEAAYDLVYFRWLAYQAVKYLDSLGVIQWSDFPDLDMSGDILIGALDDLAGLLSKRLGGRGLGVLPPGAMEILSGGQVLGRFLVILRNSRLPGNHMGYLHDWLPYSLEGSALKKEDAPLVKTILKNTDIDNLDDAVALAEFMYMYMGQARSTLSPQEAGEQREKALLDRVNELKRQKEELQSTILRLQADR